MSLRKGDEATQTIEDTGPLTRKRMETIDDETSAAAIDFMQRQVRANTPFFCWFNSTRMHSVLTCGQTTATSRALTHEPSTPMA